MNLCFGLQIIYEELNVWVLFVVCIVNKIGLPNTLAMVASQSLIISIAWIRTVK